MKLQAIELTKVRLSFVAKSGNITTYLNYINAAILAVIVLIFALNIHLHACTANSEQQPIENAKAIAAKRTSGKIIGYGITAILIALAGTESHPVPHNFPKPKASYLRCGKQRTHSNRTSKRRQLHRFLWVADDGKAVRFFIINRLPDKFVLPPCSTPVFCAATKAM